MQLFYTEAITGEKAILEDEEFRHCIKVLRKSLGDKIHFTDGSGHLFEGELIEIKKHSCHIWVQDKKLLSSGRNYQVHLAIAPTKQPKRFDWMIEKLMETGIDKITTLVCKRSEREKLNVERIRKTLISAMKQSVQTKLPNLEIQVPFMDFIVRESEERRFIAWVSPEHPKNLSQQYNPGEDVTILIGPEGDFTENEISAAISNGYLPTALGSNRLRTETAGLLAVTTVHAVNRSI